MQISLRTSCFRDIGKMDPCGTPLTDLTNLGTARRLLDKSRNLQPPVPLMKSSLVVEDGWTSDRLIFPLHNYYVSAMTWSPAPPLALYPYVSGIQTCRWWGPGDQTNLLSTAFAAFPSVISATLLKSSPADDLSPVSSPVMLTIDSAELAWNVRKSPENIHAI